MTSTENIIDLANSYIYPATLESYLKKDMLIEYLRSLDEDSLEYAMDYLEAEEPSENRNIILSLIQNEFKLRDEARAARMYPTNKVYSIFPRYTGKHIRTERSTLTIFLANNKLTEYLQTLTDGELEVAERNLYVDDITDEIVDIISAIRNEKEYRAQPKDEQNKKVVL